MKPLIYISPKVKYRVDVEPALLAELDPELLADLARPLDALLVLDVELLELDDLREVALHVHDLVLLREKLAHALPELLDDAQAQRVRVVGVAPGAAAAEEGEGGAAGVRGGKGQGGVVFRGGEKGVVVGELVEGFEGVLEQGVVDIG
jgi:hypothetical protein